jgi:hypothetical protein
LFQRILPAIDGNNILDKLPSQEELAGKIKPADGRKTGNQLFESGPGQPIRKPLRRQGKNVGEPAFCKKPDSPTPSPAKTPKWLAIYQGGVTTQFGSNSDSPGGTSQQ